MYDAGKLLTQRIGMRRVLLGLGLLENVIDFLPARISGRLSHFPRLFGEIFQIVSGVS